MINQFSLLSSKDKRYPGKRPPNQSLKIITRSPTSNLSTETVRRRKEF